jgi:PAS domain S-box-containing protein
MCLTITLIPVGIIGGFQGFELAVTVLGLIFLVTLVVSMIMAYLITLPIQNLTKNIDEISRGNLDVELEKSEIFEINNLTKSLNRVMASLKLAINKVGVKRGEIFEETLREKSTMESRYDSLMKILDGWVWEIDNNGFIQSSSDKIVKILGLQQSEIIGRKIFDFMKSEGTIKFKEVIKENIIESSKPLDEPILLDIPMLHKNGVTIPGKCSCIPFYDESGDFRGFRGVLRINSTNNSNSDTLIIPDRKTVSGPTPDQQLQEPIPGVSAEIEKQEEEQEYQLILDEKGRIVECAEPLAEMLGYKQEEILSMGLSEIDKFAGKNNEPEILNKIRQQGELHIKSIFRKKDNSSLLVNESFRYLTDQHQFICSVKRDFQLR